MKQIKLNLVVVLFLASACVKAQTIPNAGFENWTTVGIYEVPDNWGTLNPTTSISSVLTCQKGIPGSMGSSCLILTSQPLSGVGVINAIATSGILDQTTSQPKSGFAFNLRPANLTGKWQHMIFGTTQGYIDIKLTRWDTILNIRKSVANGHLTLSGMEMGWADFSIPLSYSDNLNNPDSCMITLSASGFIPTNGDFLSVDELAFTGTVTTNTGIENSSVLESIIISPNPSNADWNVTIKSTTKNYTLTLTNVFGEVIEIIKQNNQNSESIKINNDNLASGIYFLQIADNNRIKTIKLIKN